jgi:hypothetical protein
LLWLKLLLRLELLLWLELLPRLEVLPWELVLLFSLALPQLELPGVRVLISSFTTCRLAG